LKNVASNNPLINRCSYSGDSALNLVGVASLKEGAAGVGQPFHCRLPISNCRLAGLARLKHGIESIKSETSVIWLHADLRANASRKSAIGN